MSGGTGSQFHVHEEARDPEFAELADAAYQIAAHCGDREQAVLIAEMLGVGREHFTWARIALRRGKVRGH